ncbi:c-type cytochrome [Paraburkholderia sp.]|uniref:c-type cytochrome n=1 Tax=Paraburkholderia sp. TaxID=1926495 RepID=UPI003D6E1A20
MKGRSIVLLGALPAALVLASVVLTAVHAQNSPQMSKVAYKVVDGNKVDGNTLLGWKTWRALDCERCHGAQQQGLVGPSLVDAFKTLDQTEFHRTVFGGRVDKGMPDFSSSQMMQKNWENLYAYLKGRSDGQIKPGDLQAIDAK